jgi:ribosome-associated protein
MLKFELSKTEHIALCDLLKIMKLCDSGAVAKHEIADGKVKVNGAVELRKRAKIITNQIVEYKGQQIKVI